MNCSESKELLPGLVMEALSEAELAPLQEHLADCQACRLEFEETTAQLAVLDQWQLAEPPGDLAAKTMQRVREEVASSPSTGVRPLWSRFWTSIDSALQRIGTHQPTSLTGFATVFVVLGLGFYVAQPSWQRGRSSGGVTGCRNNLRLLSRALQKHAQRHQGHYPKSLSDLAADELRQLPDCPSAGHSTYVYEVSLDRLHFSLNCHGNNHQEAGLGPDSPSQSDR